MTVPSSPSPTTKPSSPPLLRSAVWVAIGALIAAAIVCVVWVLIGPQNGIIGRAFLTILLLAAFAGAAIFDANLAARRPSWYVLASMVGWVVALLAGAFKIWLPFDDGYSYWDSGFARFLELIGIVLVVRLALLHVRLYVRASRRHVTTFTRVLMIVTVVLVGVLALMLVVPLTFPRELTYPELYWRFVVAIAILAAVGTALVPLINALNSPRVRGEAPPQPVAAAYPPAQAYPAAYLPAPVQQAPQPWPTYVDGVTPLPVLPDGSPDWNAYYTGYPSPGAQAIAPVAAPIEAAPPAGPDAGYPPRPPLP